MPNLIYQQPETALWFVPAGATQPEDAAWEVDGITDGAGRQSAQLDLWGSATTPKSFLYTWRAFFQCQATPTLGTVIRIYGKTSDGNWPDNDDGTSEGAVSNQQKVRNLHYWGAVQCDEAAANIPFVKSGLIYIPHRYLQVAMFNSMSATTTTDENENGLVLIPVPHEVQ
jgi:hypothetical protein